MSISPDINDREHGKFRDKRGGVVVATTNSVEFNLNNLDDSGDPIFYICGEDGDGGWIIKKMDTTTGVVTTWANQNNNPTVTNYSDAYTNRATLTYGIYSQIL